MLKKLHFSLAMASLIWLLADGSRRENEGWKRTWFPDTPASSCKLSRPTCTFFSGGWWTLLVKLRKCFNHQSQNRKLYFQTQQFANSRGQLAHCKSEVDELKPSHVAPKCQIFGDISNFLEPRNYYVLLSFLAKVHNSDFFFYLCFSKQWTPLVNVLPRTAIKLLYWGFLK